MYALTIPADPNTLSVVSAFVWAVAAEAKLNQRKAYRLRLAVDEIMTNIITHGYAKCEGCPPIHLWVEIEQYSVSVTIEDGGEPYDITQSETPEDIGLPPEERDIGGLGVFLVVRYVDDIRYEYVNGHNVNRLTVKRND